MPTFGNLGFWEILIILVIVLLLFGAKRIPEIAGSMGKGIREFNKSLTEVDRSLLEPEPEPRIDRPPARDSLTDKDAAPPRREDESHPEPKRLLS